MNKLLRQAAMLSVFLLSACGGSPDSGAPDNGAAPAPATSSLGVVRISVTGLGTPNPTATAVNLSDPDLAVSGIAHAKVLSTLPCFLQIQGNPVDSGAFNTASEQYASFTFQVRNATGYKGGNCTSAVGTAYTSTVSNVTLVGLVEPGIAIDNTPFISLQEFDGTKEPASTALTILPTHGMYFNQLADTAEVQAGAESFQVFSESQIAGLAIDPEDASGSYLLPYGFVVRNVNPALGRTLQANPQSGEYDGQFTFAIKLPTPGSKKTAVYSFEFDLQVLVDSDTRVTESVEEQNPLGDFQANLRAITLGSTDLAVLGGSHAAATKLGDPICTVRIAGTAASPTGYLVNNSGTPSVASAPYNLQNLPTTTAINAAFCQPMTTPSGIYSQFVVSGSQSGLRAQTGHYAGSFIGGGTPVLSFSPTQPFFPGEQVSFSLTNGLTSTSSAHPVPLVGSFTVGGLLASLGEFVPRTTTATGASPISVAVGDFNGDGKPDLAVANADDGTVSILLGYGDGTYYPAPGSPVYMGSGGSGPNSVAVGDFNGDGKPDLAVALYGGDVSILLGDGSGGFTQAAGSPMSVGSQPISVVVGDFNGDGKPDLAIANNNSNSVSILLGNGSGGFTPASSSPVGVGSEPESVAVGDFNGDGKPDLAVANYGGNTVSILLGNGSGGFTAAPGSPVTVGTNPRSVAVGDFNGDGKPDLAVANYNGNSVSILLGNGSGGFTAAAAVPLGSGPFSVAVGDFNGDGKPDLAVTNLVGNTVSILLGNGSGGFTAASGSPVTVGSAPYSVAVGDFNGDGWPDLVVANSGGNSVSILLGYGGGTFIPPPNPRVPQTTAGTGTSPAGNVAADFNGDGHLDLAVVNAQDNTVSILLGNGSGGFTAASGSPVSVGSSPYSVAAGDFNGDGKPDLAVTNLGGNTVSILLGNGDGTYYPAAGSPLSVGTNPASVVVGDFNGDGKPDLAVTNFGDNTVSILLGNGSGGFTAASGSPVAVGTNPAYFAVGDFNGDGKLDLAVANYNGNSVSILLGNGSGGFTAASSSPVGVGSGPYSVAVADVNGDGKPDLAVANFSDNTVSILLGNGSGGFTAAAGSPMTVGGGPYSVAVADVNGDGKPDLAVANNGGNTVSILLGNGSGGFIVATGSPVAVGSGPTSVTVGDFYGTHKLGLAVVNSGENTVSIVPQK